MCHMSHVMCDRSHVTCHMFFLLLFLFGHSGETSWWRVCYQRGYAGAMSYYFLKKLNILCNSKEKLTKTNHFQWLLTDFAGCIDMATLWFKSWIFVGQQPLAGLLKSLQFLCHRAADGRIKPWHTELCFICCGLGLSALTVIMIFKALALWADAFYKSKCQSVCLCVRVSVCVSVHFWGTV